MSLEPTADYTLYADKRKMIGNLNKRMLLICVPLVLLMFAFCGVLSHGLDAGDRRAGLHPVPLFVRPPSPVTAVIGWLPWLLTAELFFLWWVAGRSHRKQVKPIVTLSAQGMSIDTLATHLGLLGWDEIGEVRTYNLVYRYVGIVPRDTAALCRRLGMRRSWLLWLNAACIPLYKPFGIFVAPINIPQVYLPITADELAATIDRCRLAHASLSVIQTSAHPSATENTWPPPPLRNRRDA